jgi:hypothetical protein
VGACGLGWWWGGKFVGDRDGAAESVTGRPSSSATTCISTDRNADTSGTSYAP